jgi:hypothetical protein
MSILRFLLSFAWLVVGLALLSPVLAVWLPFWFVSVTTRRARRFFEPKLLGWESLVRHDPRVGWRLQPNVVASYEGVDAFRVATDAQGWSGALQAADAKVVVFGDSNAFGYGVDHSKAYFRLCPPEVPIKAIGAPGYNLVQELLLMEDMASQLRGKLIIWLICNANDLYDNLSPQMDGYRTPFVRQTSAGDWEVVSSHVSPAPWTCSAGRHAAKRQPLAPSLHRSNYLSTRAYAACGWLIARGHELCRSAGAELIVMTVPSPFALDSKRTAHEDVDPDYPDRQLGAVCEGLGIPFVALKQHLGAGDYLDHDDHWNERGHVKVAEVIVSLFRGRAAAPPPPMPDRLRVGTAPAR